MPTNLPKSSVTITDLSKAGAAFWADTDIAWAATNYRWATDGRLPSNSSKGAVTVTNLPKS